MTNHSHLAAVEVIAAFLAAWRGAGHADEVEPVRLQVELLGKPLANVEFSHCTVDCAGRQEAPARLWFDGGFRIGAARCALATPRPPTES